MILRLALMIVYFPVMNSKRCAKYRSLRGWLHRRISTRQTGWKKIPITWNISARTETEIGSKPRQEFVGSLCCFGNIHLPKPVNHLFSPGSSNRTEVSGRAETFFMYLWAQFFRYFMRRPSWILSPGWKSSCNQSFIARYYNRQSTKVWKPHTSWLR